MKGGVKTICTEDEEDALNGAQEATDPRDGERTGGASGSNPNYQGGGSREPINAPVTPLKRWALKGSYPTPL